MERWRKRNRLRTEEHSAERVRCGNGSRSWANGREESSGDVGLTKGRERQTDFEGTSGMTAPLSPLLGSLALATLFAGVFVGLGPSADPSLEWRYLLIALVSSMVGWLVAEKLWPHDTSIAWRLWAATGMLIVGLPPALAAMWFVNRDARASTSRAPLRIERVCRAMLAFGLCAFPLGFLFAALRSSFS